MKCRQINKAGRQTNKELTALSNSQRLQTVLMNSWLKTQTISLLVVGWLKGEFRVKQINLAHPKMMNNKNSPLIKHKKT